MRRLVLLALLLLIVAASAASAVTQIRPGERAVVRRFGRVVAKPGPGLYLGLPWGMDRVDRVAVDRERRITVGFDPREQDDGLERMPEGQVVTGDHNLVDLRVEMNYTIDADQVDKFLLQAEGVNALLARTAESALADWVAARNVDDVLLRGKQLLPPWLVAEMSRRLRRYDLAVNVGKTSVVHLSPPTEVKNAFAEVARAETEITTKENEASQEADRRLREARGEIYHKEQMTAAYRREQYLQASAEAMNYVRSLEQYRRLSKQNPEYLNAVWWDEMSRLFTRMRQNGRLDMLDRYLGTDGLDITQPITPKKK
jgi:membrane protease subunit HflK